MSWTTYTVYNFADDLLESIDYHEAARKASFLGSMCDDPLMAAIHFERKFDALMKYVINSQEHPIGKVKDLFYIVEFKIRGSCHYLVTTCFFFLDWKYTPGYQFWHSHFLTDIPHESDVELCQLVKRLHTHNHSKYLKKTPPSYGRFKFPFV